MPAASTRLAARDRAAHIDEVGVERELANLGGPSRAFVNHADIALVELAAEGLHGLPVGGVVPGRPLRKRRMPCLVHANESRHRIDLLASVPADDTPRSGRLFRIRSPRGRRAEAVLDRAR